MLQKVKSNLILNNIFENIKNRIKLKIIKHNKELIKRLNVQKKDFEIYLILKEFNTRYHLSIDDVDVSINEIRR